MLKIRNVGLLQSLKFRGMALPILLLFGLDATAGNCVNPSTQADMTKCAGEEFAKVDAQLNKAYGAYRARLSATQQLQLKEAEVAWMKFRDLSCDFESSGVQGGSAFPMVRYGCLAAKTAARLKEIQELDTCKEGDLSCPVWK